MNRLGGRELADVAVVGVLFLVGAAWAGPVGGAVGGVGGEMLAGLAERGWGHARDRFLGQGGVREPDLQAAMRRAYVEALRQLEQRWRTTLVADRRGGADGETDSVPELFAMLREDADRVLTDGRLRAVTDDPEALRVLGGGTSSVRAALRRYLEPYLRGHDEQVVALVRDGLEPQLAACFAEELTADRPESNRAWRAYQLLVHGSLQQGIADLSEGQGGIAATLQNLRPAIDAVRAWGERLEAMSAEERERTGEAALVQVIEESRDTVLAAIVVESEATRGVLVAQSEATREAVAAVGDRVDEGFRGLRRDPTVAPVFDADILLRGPAEALGLQPELDRADRLPDRRVAVPLYREAARRLAEHGYAFHARLVRERQADALAAGGAVVEAYGMWLDDAAAELEAGQLWLPAGAERGLDAHRGDVGPVLAARYSALVAREGWYEQPVAAVRALRESMAVLEPAGDPWAPVVGCWLGEAVVIDEPSNPDESADVRATLERLVPIADESIAVRMRLLVAELTGEWGDLSHQASTGWLGPADAGLVLCRYGRWLALAARPDEAIDRYRQAVDKLAQAQLLGDAAGALRAMAMVQRQYTGETTEIQGASALAKQVANHPTRVERRHDARQAGVDALHTGKLPDALRNLRRYLWEARIAGHLHNERDACGLLGDLYIAAHDLPAAVAHYVRAGADKRAREVATGSPFIDVEVDLHRRAPWVVGTALAVVAAQGDLIPPAHVERIAPRLLELTAGVRQGIFRPKVDVEAWAALAGAARQLPDEFVGAVLDRIDPLVEREPGRYRVMDASLLELLVRFHLARPSARARAAALIARCLAIPDLAQRLEPYVADAIGTDEVLSGAVVGLADAADRVAVRVLAAAGVAHPAVLREVEERVSPLLDYRVGVVRHEMTVSDDFVDAARFAPFLPQARRDALGRHLVAIGRDDRSPEPHRSAAVEALGTFGDTLSRDVRAEAFAGVVPLINAPPSAHPLDTFARSSLNPFSRFRFDQSALGLPLSAMPAAARLATNEEQAGRVLEALGPAIGAGDERALVAGVQAILALDRTIRPRLDPEQLAAHPASVVRELAAALWADDPGVAPDLGLRLARDPERLVRLAIALELPKVAEREPDLGAELREIVAADQSAAVRARAEQP